MARKRNPPRQFALFSALQPALAAPATFNGPVATVRYEYSDTVPQPLTMLPHYNSRGGVDTGQVELHRQVEGLPNSV
jgi:hypothetical protein